MLCENKKNRIRLYYPIFVNYTSQNNQDFGGRKFDETTGGNKTENVKPNGYGIQYVTKESISIGYSNSKIYIIDKDKSVQIRSTNTIDLLYTYGNNSTFQIGFGQVIGGNWVILDDLGYESKLTSVKVDGFSTIIGSGFNFTSVELLLLYRKNNYKHEASYNKISIMKFKSVYNETLLGLGFLF